MKGSVSTVLNPIFWKKVQGQKHPGRWGIVEHQIPSIKVLFKTNTKGHKHPSIRLLSKSKIQLVNQRKQKVAFSPGTAHSLEIQSYRTWWGAASPILNDTTWKWNNYYIFEKYPKRVMLASTHNHDDVIKWKHVPCCCSFVMGSQWSPVDSPYKRPVARSFDDFFMYARTNVWTNRLFVGELRSYDGMWRYCNG